MATATCNICVEKFNKTTRREVTCNQCDLSACRGCQTRYILGSVNDPHCMGCKVPWNSEFIIANFTKKFFTEDLAAHRANALFEREKALMPETQARIRRIQLAEEIEGLRGMEEMYKRMNRVKDVADYRERIRELRAELGEDDPVVIDTDRRTAIRPVCGCIRDDCRGFVMNNNWKCGMCATKVCSDCLKEDEGSGHECKEEDRETRKMLLKDTKPCPKCGVMISKTDGCSQMWCVMCHTTFDWKTYEIVNNGYIHNPHYFEWARRNGQEIARAPGDVPGGNDCGAGLPLMVNFTNMVRRKYTGENGRLLLNLYRIVLHINEVTRNQLQREGRNFLDVLRMKFLQGEIDEAKYKMDLIKHERKQERNTAEWQIAELYMTQMRDLLRTVYNTQPRHLFTPEFNGNMQLADYCNDEFIRVAKAYKASRCFHIDQSIGYIRTSTVLKK